MYNYRIYWFLDKWLGRDSDKSDQQKDREQRARNKVKQREEKGKSKVDGKRKVARET
jgi:hypothetical protein